MKVGSVTPHYTRMNLSVFLGYTQDSEVDHCDAFKFSMMCSVNHRYWL